MPQAQEEGEQTVNLYFSDITSSQPLPREREVELSNLIQSGDINARNELVKANLRFVVDIARTFKNRGLSMPDLISSGNLGLLTAAERFDGSKGYKFISYGVWWIRQSILQALAEHTRTVRLPLNKLNLLRKISETSRRLSQDHALEPNTEEIARYLDTSILEIDQALLNIRSIHSLDAPSQAEEPRSLLDTLPDTSQNAPDAGLMAQSDHKQVHDALNSLSERERFIIERYFGLDDHKVQTLDQIGDSLGLTRERIRQIKERALARLRHPSRNAFFKSLLE